MTTHPRKCRGYSLVELLVVLTIVGVLATVGIVSIGNRSGGAVRQVLDELEGTLLAAQKAAVASGQDILLVSKGEWDGANPLTLTYGTANLGTATIMTNGETAPEAFRLAISTTGAIRREHLHAAVVTKPNTDWWATVTNGGNTSITDVAPFNVAATGFQDVLSSTDRNLFQGTSTISTIPARISGTNKRFTSTFWIEVVGIRNGAPIPGGPMGLLVVLGGGASIYKFYNPGAPSGGKWRRL
jgi:prepilin-type N-terminal cleavage/methylation domain-containing protein